MKRFCLFIGALMFPASPLSAKVTLKSKSSSLTVAAGAALTTENPITKLAGTVKKEEGGTIAGQPLSFTNGTFEDGNNKVKLSGSIDVSDIIEYVLNGNETFKASAVGQVLQKLVIKGKGNRIEGEPTVVGGIELEDSDAEATYALNGRIDSDLVLNGGTLHLEQDLIFSDDKMVTGSGTIVFNGRKIQLGNTSVYWTDPITFVSGSDIDLNANLFLSETWTFSGMNVINGNNHILHMQLGGEIIVDPDAQLLMKNIVVDGITGTNIRCTGTSSKITLQNTEWNITDYYNFNAGALQCCHNARFTGDGIFAYTTDQALTVAADTRLKLDYGLTFSYDPVSDSPDLFTFADVSAQLVFDGATFHVTGSGIQFKNGCVMVRRNSDVLSEVYTIIDEDELELELNGGISLGTTTTGEDMACRFLPGVTLKVTQGTLHYKNVDSSSWQMDNQFSTLRMANGTQLHIHETLPLGQGLLLFEESTLFGRVAGKTVTGTVESLGEIGFVSLADT